MHSDALVDIVVDDEPQVAFFVVLQVATREPGVNVGTGARGPSGGDPHLVDLLEREELCGSHGRGNVERTQKVDRGEVRERRERIEVETDRPGERASRMARVHGAPARRLAAERWRQIEPRPAGLQKSAGSREGEAGAATRSFSGEGSLSRSWFPSPNPSRCPHLASRRRGELAARGLGQRRPRSRVVPSPLLHLSLIHI